MQKKELKLLFDDGNLKSAFVTEVFMTEGYHLHFERKDRQQNTIYSAQQISERLFSSADAAISASRRFGFNCIEFRLIK